jgi:hypothetical protein
MKKWKKWGRENGGYNGDVRSERSWICDKIINVRHLPRCDKSSHTGVGHTQPGQAGIED